MSTTAIVELERPHRRPGQLGLHLLVAHLVEPLVPLSHGEEALPASAEDHDEVAAAASALDELGRGDRARRTPRCAAPAARAEAMRRERRPAGGDAVVHDDRGARARLRGAAGRHGRAPCAARSPLARDRSRRRGSARAPRGARSAPRRARRTPGATAPSPSSGLDGAPSFFGTTTSRAAPRARRHGDATITPPRGMPSTTAGPCTTAATAAASRAPASARSTNRTLAHDAPPGERARVAPLREPGLA